MKSMNKKRVVVYLFLVLVGAFVFGTLWSYIDSSRWQRVSLAYAPDTLPQDLPVRVYYPQGQRWPIFVPQEGSSEEWYVTIESPTDDVWIYETDRTIYKISKIQEALSLMEPQGEIALSVQGSVIPAQMWISQDEGQHGGALVFSLEHTNVAVFWWNKPMDEVKTLIATLRPVKHP